jgi:histidine triad (HIT) family protein
MSDCEYCQSVKGASKLVKIYEDKKAIAVLHPLPASPGHIIIFPKNHYQIFEQIPDYEIDYLFNLANKLSIAVFEAVGAKGTNIIINNGVAAGQEDPHLTIHIIPRNEGDGLNFQWQPRQLNEEEMSTVELQVKEGAKNIGTFEKEEKKEPIKIDELKKQSEKIKETGKGENYLIKQLERIP